MQLLALALVVLLCTAAVLREQRKIHRRIEHMDQATQAALDEVNAKVDTLIEAVTKLSTDFLEEKKQLDAALLTPGDGATIRATAAALSAKLDGAIATAQAALAAVAPAAPTPDAPAA